MNCKELDPLLAPYVDGEMEGDRAAIDRHLDRCPPCAVRAAKAAAARRLVKQRCRVLSPPAPPALRHRCAAIAHVRRAQQAGWFSWPRTALAGAVGALLVTLTIGYAVVSGSQALFVAGLTLDHVKCFALSSSVSPQANARTVSSDLRRDYGWRLPVPAGSKEMHLDLVGARRCLSSDGTVAHVLYRHDGKPVSLFMVPGHVREAGALSMLGHQSRIWSRGDTTFVLVGGEGAAGIEPVARYFEAASY